LMNLLLHKLRQFQSAPPVKGAMCAGCLVPLQPRVSIRAPREGGDPTLSESRPLGSVSIRAPREGGDHLTHWIGRASAGFNPRPP